MSADERSMSVSAAAEIERIRDRFMKGDIPREELLLHLEPLLIETASTPALVNAIEATIFSEVEPRLTQRVAELLQKAATELGTPDPG